MASDSVRVRDVTEDEVAHYHRDGWVKLPGLIEQATVTGLVEHARQLMGAGAERSLAFSEGAHKRGDHFAAMWRSYEEPSKFDPSFWEFATSPAMGRVGSRFMRNRPVRFLRDELLIKMPIGSGEGAATSWHQDFPTSSRDSSEQLNVWIALNDIPPERSTLQFLSGSHRWGSLGRTLHDANTDIVSRYPELLDECPVSEPIHLRPGDATVHHSLTVHGAPPNTSTEPRWAYTVGMFNADALYTGAPQRFTDRLEGLEVNRPFEISATPVVWPLAG